MNDAHLQPTDASGGPGALTRGGLAIKDVAEHTGLAAGTIRMWEQRYGFPEPQRTESGYRRYSQDDVETLRRARRATATAGCRCPPRSTAPARAADRRDQPSIYAAVAATDHGARPQVLRKSTLVALSRAIEHETLANAAAPVLFGAFQHEEFYREVEPRYRRIARQSRRRVRVRRLRAVRRRAGRPGRGPDRRTTTRSATSGRSSSTRPGYAACLLAWEHARRHRAREPERHDRRFESIWTVDPLRDPPRRAGRRPARRARRPDESYGRAARSGCWPTGRWRSEQPCPTLTALTNRLVAYLESAAG